MCQHYILVIHLSFLQFGLNSLFMVSLYLYYDAFDQNYDFEINGNREIISRHI